MKSCLWHLDEPLIGIKRSKVAVKRISQQLIPFLPGAFSRRSYYGSGVLRFFDVWKIFAYNN